MRVNILIDSNNIVDLIEKEEQNIRNYSRKVFN